MCKKKYSGDYFSLLATVLVTIFLVLSLKTQVVWADDFQIRVDEARLLALPKDGANIIVGNPSIADVSVHSSQLLVITGKSFGHTNLIVLDQNKKVILEKQLVVINDVSRVTSIYKGSTRTSYSCSPTCQSTLVIGDEEKYFEAISKATSAKMGVATETNGKSQNSQ